MKASAEDGPFVLLASYPKSGSTWIRACLTAYFRGGMVDLGSLMGAPALTSRHDFDDITGLTSADMSPAEIDIHRPAFHAGLARDFASPAFVKVHDAWYRNEDGEPLFSRESCRGAVYIVRHPAGVALSFAHHRGRSVDDTIALMADPGAMLDWWDDGLDPFLPQLLSSWSGHVSAWLDQRELPVLIVRYEDLCRDAAASISRILSFAGLAVDAPSVSQAVGAVQFSRLQALEAEQGFREAPSVSRPFFRAGLSEEWRSGLRGPQRARIARAHGAAMERLGYEP